MKLSEYLKVVPGQEFKVFDPHKIKNDDTVYRVNEKEELQMKINDQWYGVFKYRFGQIVKEPKLVKAIEKG